MKLTGHLTPSVFKRYAIVDEAMLLGGAEKLKRLHLGEPKSEESEAPAEADRPRPGPDGLR